VNIALAVHSDLLLGAFALVNLIIVAGYLYLAFEVLPQSPLLKLKRTRWGGTAFYLLCGHTHVELAVHALAEQAITMDVLTSWHMWPFHVAQALAVWFYISGINIEFVKNWQEK